MLTLNDGVCVFALLSVGGFAGDSVQPYVKTVFAGEKQVDDPLAVKVSMSSRKNWPCERTNVSPVGGVTEKILGPATFVGNGSVQLTTWLRVAEPTTWRMPDPVAVALRV